MTSPARLFMIAGEPSGDLLGSALIRGLRERKGDALDLKGVGGPGMEAQGLKSLFEMEELSVMGLAEVLPRLPNLLRRIRQTAEAVVAAKPDALITIDSPDFCLRVAKAARKSLPGLKVIHYVAPSVWAWRPGRARKMAQHVDHVLALLPFEPPYMEAAGMTCDFVGHPVAQTKVPGPEQIAAFRAEQGLAPADKLVLVLPGSRKGEVGRIGPVFAEVAAQLRQTHPQTAIIVPAAPSVLEEVRALFPPGGNGWPKILAPDARSAEASEERKRLCFTAGDIALAASGTVSLELAAARTPCVVAYAATPLTAFLVRKLIRIDTVTLTNLITGTRTVPEFLQEDCTAEKILPALSRLLTDQTAMAEQRRAADEAMAQLGRGGADPGLRAADSVLRQIGA